MAGQQHNKASSQIKFTTYGDIRNILHATSEAGLIEGLTALRNQLTVKSSENTISATDERLLLVVDWLESDNGAQELFAVWTKVNTRQVALICLILSVLSCLANLLSSHYTYHHIAGSVIKTVLSPQWISKLNSYLSTTHNELLLTALKLYNAMSYFNGGKDSRSVMDAFPWELKSLPKLLNLRRRSKNDSQADILSRPDIRTLYILLILSFVDTKAPTMVKAAFLEQRRDNLISIFKGLAHDSYPVVRKVLEICWSGIWADLKIKKTAKINIFNESTMGQILKLYERNVPEIGNAEALTADLVHHFLLAICARPGVGICFKDQGWYPREDETDAQFEELAEDFTRRHYGKVYNKILANVLKSLRVNEDARQQELALRILQACPELVAGYWHAAALTLEPRLSSKWIANIAFFGSAISLPVPRASFQLPDNSKLYRPNPPPLSTILENILPSISIKAHLSRGLQSTSSLVQHCTALALAKCLTKYGAVLSVFQEIQRALEEDDEDGLWAGRRRELEREVSRRVPEFQVIVAFAQQKTMQPATAVDGQPEQPSKAANVTKTALLSESAQRLLWLYQRHLPLLVAEARFDVTRLLIGIQEGAEDDTTAGLTILRRLNSLRFLNESEEFSLMGKSGSSRGNLSILLTLYIDTDTQAIKSAIATLLKRALSQTLAFQHDPHELDLWLHALPAIKRGPEARAPDDTPLSNETTAVVSFLDDCVQRCLKTPYRYLQELQESWPQTRAEGGIATAAGESSALPSPLLMTALEQLEAKFSRNLLPPADCLAVVTYIRKLMLKFAGKVTTLHPLYTVAKTLQDLLGKPGPSSIMAAISREAQALRSGLAQLENPIVMPLEHNPTVQAFLRRVSEKVTPESQLARQHDAYSIVDWVRLVGETMDDTQFAMLVGVTGQLYAPATKDLIDYVHPGHGFVWSTISKNPELSRRLDVDTLFIHCGEDDLITEERRDILIDAIAARCSTAEDSNRVVTTVQHRLAANNKLTVCRDLILFLAGFVDKISREQVTHSEQIMRFLWQLPAIRKYATSALDPTVLPAFKQLLYRSTSLGQEAAPFLEEYVELWAANVKHGITSFGPTAPETVVMWLHVMDQSRLLGLLDHFHLSTERSSPDALLVLDGLLSALSTTVKTSGVIDLPSRLPQWRALVTSLPDSAAAKHILSTAIRTSLPLFYDGLFSAEVDQSAASLVTTAQNQWKVALRKITEPIDVTAILQQTEQTPYDIFILAAAMYKSRHARIAIRAWALTCDISAWPVERVAAILYAYLDTSSTEDGAEEEGDSVVTGLYKTVFVALTQALSPETEHACRRLVSLLPSLHPHLAARVLETIQPTSKQHPPAVVFSVLSDFPPNGSDAIHHAISRLVEHASTWVVSALSSAGVLSQPTRDLIANLAGVIKQHRAIATQSAETLALAAVQHRLQDSGALSLAYEALKGSELKPVTVNRILQTILQHQRFLSIGRTIDTAHNSARDRLVAVLDLLFRLHPANTCQTSHVDALLPLYGGTMSGADCKLLGIFKLFEAIKKLPVSSLLSQWSSTPETASFTALESVQSLDSTRMLRTCLQFPQRASLGQSDGQIDGENIYDPVFVVLLFSRMLDEGTPETASAWVQMLRTNIVSVLIRALSARNDDLREIAMVQLAGLYRALQAADLQEKPHVLYVLDLLKDIYARNSTEEHPPRLAVFITLHLAHALRGVFYPSNFIYPLTARFLLQRPELDTNDMPLLYSMLYSVSDQWRKERAWIVRFMSDGMVGRQEWRILKKRHTWDLLSSMFHNEESDSHLRRSIMELLANLTCERHAVTSLVLGSALLSWIELQLQNIRADEGLGWAKILENILVIIDAQKLEASTAGEWRSIIVRCLSALVHSKGCNGTLFAYVVQIVLRLSNLSTVPAHQLQDFLRLLVGYLRTIEADIHLPSTPTTKYAPNTLSLPPHRSHVLWKPTEAPATQIWGECVESLWTIAMRMDEWCKEWDELTAKLLVWRAWRGPESKAGEWARKEVVRNLVDSEY
ncbi:hypothetical protein BDW22DRAFT_1383778 [Trametopsis cervina]|nr:hypothetical protein BDW22DRAFT_1383778 [Trametopsis cervina]